MEIKIKIGIVGIGMVGGPLKRYFEEYLSYERGKNLYLFDTDPVKNFLDNINKADIIFISVPTPRSPDGSANTSAVEQAISKIKGSKTIVIKSTVPPGTTEKLQAQYPAHRFLFNPEFLTERRAWEDFTRPDRQIVGFTKKSIDAAYLVLSFLPKAPFMSPGGISTYKPLKISATEAEIIKYGGNIHFARKINFANVLAMLAGTLAADYENVRLGMAADYRIGDSHLDVSHGGYRGFGGFCLPKDLDALIMSFQAANLDDCAILLLQDREFNEKLLAHQGLTMEDVSVHDHEWIQKKLKNKMKKSK